MKVRFSPRARRRVRAVAASWRKNRPGAPHLFDDALARASDLLSATPRLGVIYKKSDGDVIYRLLLPKTEQHVYYTVDEGAQVVMLLTVWGARRGRGPKL